MAYPLFGERHSTAAFFVHPVRALLRWIGRIRARRAQRMSLARLLDLDPALLRDVGIERRDVIEAMELPHPHASSLFDARRRRLEHDE